MAHRFDNVGILFSGERATQRPDYWKGEPIPSKNCSSKVPGQTSDIPEVLKS